MLFLHTPGLLFFTLGTFTVAVPFFSLQFRYNTEDRGLEVP